MYAPYLKFLFVIIVYSSTICGADPVFRVEIFSTNYQSLDAIQVRSEYSNKNSILYEIAAMKTAPEKDWTKYFKKLVEADQQIVQLLNIHLSYLNENIYKNVASLYNNRLIPADSWNTIKTKLDNYLRFLDGLDFPNMLWNRSFLGNPFESILSKLKLQRFVSLNRNVLKTTFEDTYQTVEKAHEQIMIIIDNLKEDLEDQRVKTRNVVIALDDLNDDLLVYQMNIGQSTKQIEKLINTLQIVSDAVAKFKKPKMSLNCFTPTTSWKEKLTNQLKIIDNAHKQLNVAIGALK